MTTEDDARAFRAARIRAGLSPTELAAWLGVDPTTVARWESAADPPEQRAPALAPIAIGAPARRAVAMLAAAVSRGWELPPELVPVRARPRGRPKRVTTMP